MTAARMIGRLIAYAVTIGIAVIFGTVIGVTAARFMLAPLLWAMDF